MQPSDESAAKATMKNTAASAASQSRTATARSAPG